MAPSSSCSSSSSSSSLADRGSLSPQSSASTTRTDISSSCSSKSSSSGSPFDLATTATTSTFRNDPIDKASVFIAPVADDDVRDDPMFMSAWRFCAARLVGVTAVAPELLGLYLCRYQLGALMARWSSAGGEAQLPLAHMLISLGLITNAAVGCLEGLSMATVKLSTLLTPRRPRLRLLGAAVPSVDVFITVCAEPFAVVRDTVLGALAIDYPRERFRVIVTDDGGSAKLRAWVEDEMMAGGTCNLHYHARGGEDRGGWKAGNLNAAIAFAERLPGGAAQCVAGLDADMIPVRGWLRSVAAQVMADERVGMVCPAQLFYNIPSNDPLHQANTFDWRAKRLVFDLAGNGWNYGSGWIMRRAAVDNIGGFPEDIVTEDVSSSAMAIAAGWKTMYIPEGLQYGLVPETYVAYIKQMTRWHVGESQTATKFGFYLDRAKTKHMTPLQRWVQTAQGLNTHVRTPVTVLHLVLLSLVFLTGMPLAPRYDTTLLRLDCAVVLLRWAHECHYAVLTGYRAAVGEACKALYLSPYCLTAYIRTFLIPRRLGGAPATFTPTGSISPQSHERDPAHQAPLAQRLRHILGRGGAWVHLLVASLFVCAAAVRLARALVFEEDVWREVMRYVAWPSGGSWLVAVLGLLTPLRYACWPPVTGARERLLGGRDGGTGNGNGARYPREEVRGRGERRGWGFGFVEGYTLYVAFVAGVLVMV